MTLKYCIDILSDLKLLQCCFLVPRSGKNEENPKQQGSYWQQKDLERVHFSLTDLIPSATAWLITVIEQKVMQTSKGGKKEKKTYPNWVIA